jgi:hypothetical protein
MTIRAITLSAEHWQQISDALDCYCDEGCPEGGSGWKSAKLSNAVEAFGAELAKPEPGGLTLDCDKIPVPDYYAYFESSIYQEGYASGWAAGIAAARGHA